MSGNGNVLQRRHRGVDEGKDETVRLLRALGHPLRFQILRVVTDPRRFAGPGDLCGDCELVCACRLRILLHLSAPDLSHHIKVLKEAELLQASKRGNLVHYRARPEILRRILPPLADLAQARSSGGSSSSKTCASVESAPGRIE